VKFAFFGDVVGRAGRRAITTYVPDLRASLGLDAVIVNAENAAGGFGITPSTAQELFDAGVDVLRVIIPKGKCRGAAPACSSLAVIACL